MDVLSITTQKDLQGAFDEGMKSYGGGQFYKVWSVIYSSGAHGEKPSGSAWERMGVKGKLTTISRADNPQEPEPFLTAPAPKVFTVTHERWAGAVKYNKEIAEDDELNWYPDMAKSMGEATMFAKEISMMEPINASTTFISGWDQLSLANVAHRLLTGATFDNTLPAAAPSEALLTSITGYFDKVPDAAGRPTPVRSIFIVTQLNNVRVWRQLLNAVKADLAIQHPGAGGGLNQNSGMPSQFSADQFTVQGTPYIYGVNKHVALGPQHGLATFKRLARDRMYTRNAPEELVHATVQRYWKGWSSANQILVIG